VALQSSGIPPEVLRKGLEIPFAIAAGQTGFAGFALSREESEPLIPLTDQMLVKYLPNLGPYSLELLFVGSVLSLAGVKYLAYLDFKQAKAQEASATKRASG